MLAAQGAAKVLLHYNSYKVGVEEVAADLKAAGCAVEMVQANLGTTQGIRDLIAALPTLVPQVDILINNAGHLVKRTKLAEFTMELWDEVMDLNAKSVYFLAQAVAPSMIANGSGHIVNISSIAARNGGGPGATIYAASKAAVACITKGLAKELAPAGIRVNAVSPGTVDNYFHEKHSNKQILDSVIAQTPAGKLGTNEEIADAIEFLISDKASYMIGQTLEINGGMFMI